MDALEAHVKKVVAEYEGATYDLTSAQAIKDAKHDRSYLNGIKKEIDERRKAVKREYSKPLDAFEKRCKQITAIIDEVNRQYQGAARRGRGRRARTRLLTPTGALRGIRGASGAGRPLRAPA